MKTPTEEHDLTRWIDGEMNDEERAMFEERLKHEPTLDTEARKMRALSASLRAYMPAEMRIPHADYFNTQISVRITQMALDEVRARQSRSSLSTLLQWMRQPWFGFALAGAALVAVGFTLYTPASGDASDSMILSSYTPNTKVQARTYHDPDADATVLMLDGLDAMPADRKITGINIRRTETEPELASTTMYDEKGSAVLMISRDGLGNPLITPEG